MLFKVFNEKLIELGYRCDRCNPGEHASYRRDTFMPIITRIHIQKNSQSIGCFVGVGIVAPSIHASKTDVFFSSSDVKVERSGLIDISLVSEDPPWREEELNQILEAWERFALPWLSRNENIESYIRLLKDEYEFGIPTGFVKPTLAQSLFGKFLFGQSIKARSISDVRRPPGHLVHIAYAYIWLSDFENAVIYLKKAIEIYKLKMESKSATHLENMLRDIEIGEWCHFTGIQDLRIKSNLKTMP